jgi:N-acetylmuramoyl-L-alanine amidase
MPAILIEIGHITHPATEKNLLSPQWRRRLARAIRSGIEIYLENHRIDQ